MLDMLMEKTLKLTKLVHLKLVLRDQAAVVLVVMAAAIVADHAAMAAVTAVAGVDK